MTTMDCTDIKALVSGLIDDEVDPDTRHEAERHLSECRPCRDLLSAAEALDDGIIDAVDHSYEPGALPSRFESAVLSATVHERAARAYFAHWTNWMGWIAAAACLALAVVMWFERTPAIPTTRTELIGPPAPGPAGVRSTSYAVGDELRSQVQVTNLPPSAYALPQPASEIGPPARTDAAQREAQLDDMIAVDAMSQEDAETLYAASLLMDMVARIDAGGGSFAQADRVRRITEYDNLLPRLAEARKNAREKDREMIFAAETILLRIVRGPISVMDLQELREAVNRMKLNTMLETASNRWKPASV